jgi:inosine-uridine nucleoside N-ribohydrolase
MKAAITLLLALAVAVCPAQKRLVLIDQDGSGPGGSNQMAMLALLQSPQAEVLGITIVTGNAWRDEESMHTLRMLELTGHANVPVAKGAVFPLVRTQQETRILEAIDGKTTWLGAWGQGPTKLVESSSGSVIPVIPEKLESHDPYEIPPLPEGSPASSPSTKMPCTSSFARYGLIRIW